MAVTDNWTPGETFDASDENDVARAINGSGWLKPCHYATTGSETYTLSGGDVSQISGTSLDGGSPSIGDRILIKDAPLATGTGSSFSSHPGNGVYQVTSTTTNLSVSRVYEMSNTPSTPYSPGGEAVAVMAGVANAGLVFIVINPNSPATPTYGSDSIQWAPVGYVPGTGLSLSGATLSLSSATLTSLGLANTSVQSVSAANSSVTVSGTTSVTVKTNTPSGVLKGDGSGGFSTAVTGTDYTTPTGAENLSSKTLGNTNTVTLKGANFTLQDGTDTTKQAQFVLSALATGTTRSFTLPNANDTLVGLSATQALTHKDLTDATNTFPTLNQNTTGSAAKWTTARNLAGNSVDGSANVAFANKFVVQGTSDSGLSGAQFLGSLSTGLLKSTTTTGVLSIAVASTDYAPATTGSSALKANGSGGFANATLNDVGAPTASFSMNSQTITSLGTPVNSADAANKAYVDAAVQGLDIKNSAVAATTGAETYTIVSGSVTQLNGTTVDGVSPAVNDYILIKDAPASTGLGSAGSTQPGNGLYQVTSNTTNLSLIRAADMAGSNPPAGSFSFVQGGTANGSSGWVVSTPSTNAAFTYGTGNIKWTQFSGAGEITAGTGLSKSGNTLSISLTGGTAITVTGASIAVTGASIGPTQLSATGSPSGSTYLRGDNTWSNFTTDARAAFSAGTAITIASGVVGVTNASIGTTQLSATGTPSSSTYLRGDNTWSTLSLGTTSLSALSAPTGAISWAGFGITSLANPANATDAATKVYVDSAPFHPSCRVATTGIETFTVTSGTVTQISGTSVDGVSPSVGERILIKDAPATTGTGSVLSSQPGNGIYVVTANATNLSVSRVADMSSGGSAATPAGSAVIIQSGSANSTSTWKVSSPSSSASFTYGTTAIQWAPDFSTGNVLTRSGNTISVLPMSTGQAIIGNGGTPTIATLSGDVTVGATGTTTIGAGTVSLSKLASLTANSVIGNQTGSTGTPTAVSMTTAASGGAVALRDANANLTVNAIIEGSNTTATAAGTTTLTAASTAFQQFTGTTTQTCVLPNATILTVGQTFTITNRSTGAVTVNANGGGLLQVMAASSEATFTLMANGGFAGTWDVSYVVNGLTGTVTSASVVTANGFQGTVATATSTPAITIQTSLGSGLVKSNGSGALVSATVGTDYGSPDSATATLASKTLTAPIINGYTEGVTAVGTVTTSSTLSISSGTVLTATLTASTACTFTMPTVAAGASFVLILHQAASTGGGTATFTGVKWVGGNAPAIAAAVSTIDIYSFFSDGTNWYGSPAQAFS